MEGIIELQKISKGKDENSLVFDGDIPNYDNSRICKFIFDGIKICYTNSSITDVAKAHLAQNLKEDFGMPPYDFIKKKKQFASGKIYTLEFC